MNGIALGGFMGVGKTTIGTALSEVLGLPFVDTDAELERRFGPIPEQFLRSGEDEFRKRETELIASLVDGQPRVIATGGGAWASTFNRELLGRQYRRVVLQLPWSEIDSRISASNRPNAARAAELWLARASAYTDADDHVDALGTVGAVVVRILKTLPTFSLSPIAVDLEQHSYSVHVTEGFDQLGESIHPLGSRAIVVSDPRVGPLWRRHVEVAIRQKGVEVSGFDADVSEGNKNLMAWEQVVNGLLSRQIDRHTVVVALGGGVVGDVVGFAAATVLRGVRFVQVPTTVLAIADSSVGGKTGVNHSTGKNLIGAFHQPHAVVAPLCTLSTLERREAIAGLAEIIKIALVADRRLFEMLEETSQPLAADLVRSVLLRNAVAAKAKIVMSDERELGARILLNAGHTVGHALEAATGFSMLHGEAVAIGLMAELQWAQRLGTPRSVVERCEAMLTKFELPVQTPSVDKDVLFHAAHLDKKVGRGIIRLPVCSEIGVASIVEQPLSEMKQLLGSLG